MATPLKPIECSAQPLSISFHPAKDIVAAGLVDGTVEIHDLIAKVTGGSERDGSLCASSASSPRAQNKSTNDDDIDMGSDNDNDDDDQDEADTILSSIHVAREAPTSKTDTQMLAKMVDDNQQESTTTSSSNSARATTGKATQSPSCRCVLFSHPPHHNEITNDSAGSDKQSSGGGGEYIYTACNGGSLRCIDTELACNSLDHYRDDNKNDDDSKQHQSPIVWSIENAHNSGINKLYQLPRSSPCGPLLVSGDDIGTVRLWDTTICGKDDDDTTTTNNNNNPFDNLMKLPKGCVQHWKVNHDYITDFEVSSDGNTLFASSADGTLSVFDLRFVHRKNTPRSVTLPDVDPRKPQPTPREQARLHKQKSQQSSWDKFGYVQSDNQDDELLSIVLIKQSKKLLCGTQQGILAIFSYGTWGDISDRFPGHPQSIDALLKVDEDTVLTGSSDGLVRAVQLLPNALLGVLGGHDGFPVEALGWSAGRRVVGSLSHDEHIRLWDASLLNEDDDDDEEENGEGGGKGGNMEEGEDAMRVSGLGGGVSTKAKAGDNDDDNSEDDWDDMDEDDDIDVDSDDSDDDSDDGGGGTGGKPKKREQIFKSENEEFFSDL